MSSLSSPTESKIPRLASASSGQSGLPHSVWRPQMQTFLMRQGIEERDYSEPFPEWKAVVDAINADEKAEEQAAIAEMLGRSSAAAAGSTTLAATSSTKTAEQTKRKQRVINAVARVRKAYAFLYAALPTDLRTLVADVPQGYAYGVWSFLEKKFRNTEQDNVMALWEQLTTIRQERHNDSEESFDEYKARVDSVKELLENAKQTISSGLYASLLLWRLRPAYQTAVLTLKTGDKLQDTDKIDWRYIAEYMGQFERSQQELNDIAAGIAGEDNTRAYAAKQHKQKKPPHVDIDDVQCYNCRKFGHYAADCARPDRRQLEGGRAEQHHRGGENGNEARRKGRERHSPQTSDSDSSGDEKRIDSDDDADETRQRRRRPQERADMARQYARDATPDYKTAAAGRSYIVRAVKRQQTPSPQRETKNRTEQESRAQQLQRALTTQDRDIDAMTKRARQKTRTSASATMPARQTDKNPSDRPMLQQPGATQGNKIRHSESRPASPPRDQWSSSKPQDSNDEEVQTSRSYLCEYESQLQGGC